MGTSGSFGGSGGKDARDLRDNIADWLDGPRAAAPAGSGDAGDVGGEANPADPLAPRPADQRPQIDLGPALRVLLRPRGRGGGADGPGGGGGGARGGGAGSRTYGGVARSAGRVSKAAGRAGHLALAYSVGNREALREAGLNYDELRALGDPVAIGIKIVEAAFESQSDSTVADAEERDIVASVVEWILQQPADHPPTPEEVVRKSIETTIAETALTEVSATVYAKAANAQKRRDVERQIRDVAAELALQATLSPTGATAQEMAMAIEGGIRDIGKIFGVKS